MTDHAELYARSAAYASAMGNPKLADTFTRRGIAAAGGMDEWAAVYARATGEMAPEPQAQPEPTKAERTTDEALERQCPQCKAEPGMKCHDYRGKNCAPHSDRKKAI